MKQGVSWAVVGTAVLLALLWLLIPRPEPIDAPRRIALIQLTDVDLNTVAGFRVGLAAQGYAEGRDLVFLSEGPAGDIERLDAIIGRLLAQHPDLILVSSTPATQAVKRLTEGSGIPVVFAPVNDPLDAGIVSDLKRPGGSITGVRLPLGDDLRMPWLLRIAPGIRRVYLPYTRGDRSAEASLEKAREAAQGLGLALVAQAFDDYDDLDAVLASLPAEVDALFIPRDSRAEARIERFVAFARVRRLPLSVPSRMQVQAGALFSYGFVHEEIGRQAARLAGQVLRGIPVGDLPVEMAENSLTLNLGAARAIGLDIPESLLAQADLILAE